MITVEELINNIDKYLIIDLRSPVEYESGHIKSAINLPILNNEAREMIGKLYKQNQSLAYEEGYKIGTKVIPSIYESLSKLIVANPTKEIIFYCFRGGTRSSSVNQAINEMGISAVKLDGGYKAYRKYLLLKMDEFINKLNFIVVAGHTGSGKTIILNKLDYPVIDLEGIAKHRGSIFGKMGIKEEINQRDFEDELFYQLKALFDNNLNNIFIEAESRKIGDIFLPKLLNDKIRNSTYILINRSVKARTKIILSMYAKDKINDEFIIKLLNKNHFFKQRLGHEWIKLMTELINNHNYEEFVERILIDYYDKLYDHSQDKYSYDLIIDEDNEEVIIKKISQYYNSL